MYTLANEGLTLEHMHAPYTIIINTLLQGATGALKSRGLPTMSCNLGAQLGGDCVGYTSNVPSLR